MQISSVNANLLVLAAVALSSCSSKREQSPVLAVDKPFVTAGSIEMQLDGGDYTIRAGKEIISGSRLPGSAGNASANLEGNGLHAKLGIKDTPHNKFRATVEVPATADLTVHLSGGNLEVFGVTGNKDIDAAAGNVGISTPNANDYASVDATVKAGDLSGGPFGERAPDFPRTSNGRALASTRYASVSAPAIWN